MTESLDNVAMVRLAKRFVAKLVRLKRDLGARRTHPNVRNSRATDLSQVHRSARIFGSQLDGSVAIGEQAILDLCSIVANAKVTIGRGSILTGPIRLIADKNPVCIGKFCSIAPDVIIWESLHDIGRVTTSYIRSQIFGEEGIADFVSKGPIHIGNDVWIGARAVVLSGVTIGDGAVVGAGAVVTRDVPPYSVAVGSPARVVKSRFPEPVCERLLDLKWWDWPEDKIRRNRSLFYDPFSLESLDRIE